LALSNSLVIRKTYNIMTLSTPGIKILTNKTLSIITLDIMCLSIYIHSWYKAINSKTHITMALDTVILRIMTLG
jgi:hypothetical protein